MRSVTGKGEPARMELRLKGTVQSIAEKIISIDRHLPQLRRDEFVEQDGVFRFVTSGGFLSWGQIVIVSIERADGVLAESRFTRDEVGMVPVAVEVQARQRLGVFQTQQNQILANAVASALQESRAPRARS